MDKNIAVLIVDDHQSMRRTIADVMRKLGFTNLHYAEDGKMAWDKMQKEHFDLLLLDWNMPRMTGLELLKLLRSEGGVHKDVPILMVTAEAEKDQVVSAIHAGVNNYIVKPFPPVTLERKLREIEASMAKQG